MIPKFANKDDLQEFIETKLQGDKSKLFSLKKATYKQAETVRYNGNAAQVIKPTALKAGIIEKNTGDPSTIVRAIINTTNVFDSHGDVHLPGIWKKSISENKDFLHLQEHKQSFDSIISQEGIMSTQSITWRSLGYEYDGETEALVFDSDLTNSDNDQMVKAYKEGKVKNHSVGMRYVKMLLCVDSEEKYWAEEKELFDTYIDQIVNKEAAIEDGMFWAVKEAKVIEGSAVVLGSNEYTPTLWVKDSEAAKGTSQTEPRKHSRYNSHFL